MDRNAAKTSLKKLQKIYLSSGDRDQFALHIGADTFASRCREHGIEVEVENHKGNHSLLVRQLEAGIKALLC